MQSSVGKDDKPGVMGKVESGRELSTASEWIIQNGTCFVIFAYDAARTIDLEGPNGVSTNRPATDDAHKRRSPSYFEYQPPPVRLQPGNRTGSSSTISHSEQRWNYALRFWRGDVIYSYRLLEFSDCFSSAKNSTITILAL